MPTSSEILREIGGAGRLNYVRRRYMAKAHQKTGRNVILYASSWDGSPQDVAIQDDDLYGMMEVVHGLEGPDLDFVIQSQGGSVEAAEALVDYLRSKFKNIRVIVPQFAKSAAAMIACAANTIVLGRHSFLGPTDPQFFINTPLGWRMAPAQAILKQFDNAVKDSRNPAKYRVWLPILSQYGPELLVRCEQASQLSTELVTGWLQEHMFARLRDRKSRARRIAKWLSRHEEFMTHGRHISREILEQQGLLVTHLEDDQEEQDIFLSIFHSTVHTFNLSPVVKIIENHRGNTYKVVGNSLKGR